MFFENAVEIYLDWKATHASTAPSRYAIHLSRFADFIGKAKRLKDVTGDDVIRFHRHMGKVGYVREGLVQDYSLSTIAYSTRILKNFFMFWHGRRESDVNHKEILPIRHVVPIKRVISEKEFREMDKVLDPHFFDDMRKKLAIHLLWDTGMRVSELCDLNISDIQDKHPVYGVRSATIRTRKTMRYNLVAWSKETDDLLIAYLGLRFCIDAKNDALLLSSKSDNATPITVRTIQRWIEEVSEVADLGEGITPHSFRHGKGHSILSTPGSNIRDVSAILRHARPESSYHYLSLNRDQYLETASKYLAVL
jgi:site-specific recombinase XerD